MLHHWSSAVPIKITAVRMVPLALSSYPSREEAEFKSALVVPFIGTGTGQTKGFLVTFG
jgi:hypothetical protein